MPPDCQDADKLEAWITAFFAHIGLPTTDVSGIRTATLQEIASSAAEVASIVTRAQSATMH
jgi:hypothetical protein